MINKRGKLQKKPYNMILTNLNRILNLINMIIDCYVKEWREYFLLSSKIRKTHKISVSHKSNVFCFALHCTIKIKIKKKISVF